MYIFNFYPKTILSFQAEAEEKVVSTKEVLMKLRVVLAVEGAEKCTDHRAGRKGKF